MKKTLKPLPVPSTPPKTAEPSASATMTEVNRRSFLGGVGGLTLGTMASGLGGAVATTLLDVDEVAAEETAPQGPNQRRNTSFQIRRNAAQVAKQMPLPDHKCNGDEEAFPNRIGNFHKGLPHNALGEVDPFVYDDLLKALADGDFAQFEALTLGGTSALLNPLGGLAFTLDGADGPAIGVDPPPSITSAQLAAQAAELYWMALLRDVPFADYPTDSLVAQAAADLSGMSGYEGPRDNSGDVTPQLLFRLGYPSETAGPIVSQFLLRAFAYDGIPIDPKFSTAAPGIDFLTAFDEYLEAANGFPGGAPPADPRDPVLRYPRSVRDLGRLAGADTIFSAYFRASIIAGGFGAAARDAAIPYQTSTKQGGFATFGGAHLADLVGHAHKAERHTWYQKWNVHRFLRPEAFGVLVHNVKSGAASYPLHPDILNSPVLPLIFDANRAQNLARLGRNEGSWLLPQLFHRGSPQHPSFPAGHAVSAGSCVAMLKAWFNEDFLFPSPVKASADGLSLSPYVAGVDGPPLTVGGELNKLCHNLSIGRDMSGVHWRADDVQGNAQGEESAIRLLREEKAIYPEPFTGFTLRKYNGDVINV